MGKRGPRPKPTNLRVLHGDRTDRTNRSEPGEGGLRPLQLRHFSVTQLLAAGVPEVEVMGRHGHASASSMKPYRHYIRARDRMSTHAMRDVLDGPTPAK
jgi:hypothetical protein